MLYAPKLSTRFEAQEIRRLATKKVSTAAVKATKNFSQPKLTIETLPLTDWRLPVRRAFLRPDCSYPATPPAKLRASRGRVINVTSIGGIMPGPMIAAYQAAKAALEAVSDSMRIEFSPFGVHVSAICPRRPFPRRCSSGPPSSSTGSRSTRGSATKTHATRACFHHNGPVRQCLGLGQAQSQSPNRATPFAKTCESRGLHSINKGNCVAVPLYWTVLDTRYKCPIARNLMIALVAGGGFEPPTFGL
jgi:hypothetical protein